MIFFIFAPRGLPWRRMEHIWNIVLFWAALGACVRIVDNQHAFEKSAVRFGRGSSGDGPWMGAISAKNDDICLYLPIFAEI
jgi:hypothetical protein